VSDLLDRDDVKKSTQLAWPWAPATLLGGDLRLEEYRLDNWVAEINALLMEQPLGERQA
jgi:hypothetical protein